MIRPPRPPSPWRRRVLLRHWPSCFTGIKARWSPGLAECC
jgi:hypothetical protein